MSLSRMKRSYSTSHAHHSSSYGVTHTVPSLGQGATVVRTPADATMCMAQPGPMNGNSPWPFRNNSLKEPPHRRAPTPLQKESLSGSRLRSRPTLPKLKQSPSLDADTESGASGQTAYHYRHNHSQNTSVSTEYADLDAEYQRRQASRTSNATITLKRYASNNASTASPSSAASATATTPTVSAPWNDHLLATRPSDQPDDQSHSHNGRWMDHDNADPSIHSHSHTAIPRYLGDCDFQDPFSRPSGRRVQDGMNGNGSRPGHGQSSSVHRPLDDRIRLVSRPANLPAPRPGLVRSATVPSKPCSHVPSSSHSASPSISALSFINHVPARGSLALRVSNHADIGHASSCSVSAVISGPPAPFAPILVSHTTRVAPGPSAILVTLRFSYSLDAEPNTHQVTVTLDTLRPAGGRLIKFIDNVLRPNSVQSNASNISDLGYTPPLSVHGPDMTDCSSAEDSDFEYDDTRSHPALQEEILVSLAMSSSPSPSPKPDGMYLGATSLSRQASNSSISRQSSRRGLGPPPSAYPGSLGFGTPLPPLSALPAALAQARAEREAATASAAPLPGSGAGTPPLIIRRPRSNTCPGPAKGTITELTVLLQRDAGAWHAIASRLCSGSWPEMAGRRRRVEDECRWAGMNSMLAELSQMPTLSRRGGFV